jgi:hypothetical protein
MHVSIGETMRVTGRKLASAYRMRGLVGRTFWKGGMRVLYRALTCEATAPISALQRLNRVLQGDCGLDTRATVVMTTAERNSPMAD